MKFIVVSVFCAIFFIFTCFQNEAKNINPDTPYTSGYAVKAGSRKQVEVSKLPKRVLRSFESSIFHNMKIVKAFELKDQDVNKKFAAETLYELKTESIGGEMLLIYDKNGNLRDALNDASAK